MLKAITFSFPRVSSVPGRANGLPLLRARVLSPVLHFLWPPPPGAALCLRVRTLGAKPMVQASLCA